MIRMTVHNLSLTSDALTLLDGIGIEARPGRIHLIVGPAGSGKTLLGRTLAGLELDSTGEIYLDGRDVIDIPPGLRRIAWAPSENSLWPGYSVGANVEFGLKRRGVGRQERRSRVSEALGWFGVDSLKHRRAESLELPDARRVALARALAVDPQVLVVDEPLKHLADETAESLRDTILRVQAEQRVTTLILTRNAEPWWESVDRVSLIDQGTIIQSGTPEEVLQRPFDERAATFFGECNVIEGVAEAVDPRGEALVRTAMGRLLGRTAVSGARIPKQGDPVLVMIRPGAIGLVSGASTGSTQLNRVPVRVTRSRFAGRLVHIDLEGPSEVSLVALATPAYASSFRPDTTMTAVIPADQVSIALPWMPRGIASSAGMPETSID
jgi:ABC-type Fe3+/spermidine/putrescine transport system ATPase subunit